MLRLSTVMMVLMIMTASAVGSVTVPASAAGTGHPVLGFAAGGFTVGALGVERRRAVPNVDIAGPGPLFVPNSVTGRKVVSVRKCERTATLTITNATAVAEQVTYASNGIAFGPPIPPRGVIGFCAPTVGNLGDMFSLASNRRASLTVTVKR